MTFVPVGVQRLFSHHRHPILIPLCLLLWTSFEMTADRALLATTLSLYMLLSSKTDTEDVVYAEKRVQDAFETTFQK